MENDIALHKNLLLAGRMALELFEDGVEKDVAIGRASTVFAFRK